MSVRRNELEDYLGIHIALIDLLSPSDLLMEWGFALVAAMEVTLWSTLVRPSTAAIVVIHDGATDLEQAAFLLPSSTLQQRACVNPL